MTSVMPRANLLLRGGVGWLIGLMLLYNIHSMSKFFMGRLDFACNQPICVYRELRIPCSWESGYEKLKVALRFPLVRAHLSRELVWWNGLHTPQIDGGAKLPSLDALRDFVFFRFHFNHRNTRIRRYVRMSDCVLVFLPKADSDLRHTLYEPGILLSMVMYVCAFLLLASKSSKERRAKR